MKQLLIAFLIFNIGSLMAQSGKSDRVYWLQQMDKMARPVMEQLAADRLKESMAVELAPNIDNKEHRLKVAYLEAFGRTFSGIAPWVNGEGGSTEEQLLRNKYFEWSTKAVANAVDPNAKDYMYWGQGQPLVDAAFLALGFIRAPKIWMALDSSVKTKVVNCFRSTRAITPSYSNWLLFSAMIETFFLKYGYEYDLTRIDFAVKEFSNHWYVGDGLYSDGMLFHMDYYNSIVIHPFLITIVKEVMNLSKRYESFLPKMEKAAARYAELQERSINADGTYPIIGRSITYRTGVFHHLAFMSVMKQLPASLHPAQVRCALTATIGKTLGVAGSYDAKGWLRIGVSGFQPGLADFYITTGSLYICSEVFLPLGLPETDLFWSAPAQAWTSKKLWAGEDGNADHAVDL
ncbi:MULTISPECIES: DUF2264 domain-containing protein [unclassified Paraflavitalea]|uniref:DUF2264 domain-containing protein n=1 Tax=unclassified Paraflavitalea TaxID=2798305 RepID=UPI003D3414F8